MQTVRMRNKAKVTQLNIPAHKVDAIKYVKENVIYSKSRNNTIKDILGHSLCCLCEGVPSVKVSYDLGGARRIETYCESCISKVYERDEPTDKNELAAKYGCVAVNSDEMPRRDIYNTSD